VREELVDELSAAAFSLYGERLTLYVLKNALETGKDGTIRTYWHLRPR
jgi:hypothetical protein